MHAHLPAHDHAAALHSSLVSLSSSESSVPLPQLLSSSLCQEDGNSHVSGEFKSQPKHTSASFTPCCSFCKAACLVACQDATALCSVFCASSRALLAAIVTVVTIARCCCFLRWRSCHCCVVRLRCLRATQCFWSSAMSCALSLLGWAEVLLCTCTQHVCASEALADTLYASLKACGAATSCSPTCRRSTCSSPLPAACCLPSKG